MGSENKELSQDSARTMEWEQRDPKTWVCGDKEVQLGEHQGRVFASILIAGALRRTLDQRTREGRDALASRAMLVCEEDVRESPPPAEDPLVAQGDLLRAVARQGQPDELQHITAEARRERRRRAQLDDMVSRRLERLEDTVSGGGYRALSRIAAVLERAAGVQEWAFAPYDGHDREWGEPCSCGCQLVMVAAADGRRTCPGCGVDRSGGVEPAPESADVSPRPRAEPCPSCGCRRNSPIDLGPEYADASRRIQVAAALAVEWDEEAPSWDEIVEAARAASPPNSPPNPPNSPLSSDGDAPTGPPRSAAGLLERLQSPAPPGTNWIRLLDFVDFVMVGGFASPDRARQAILEHGPRQDERDAMRRGAELMGHREPAASPIDPQTTERAAAAAVARLERFVHHQPTPEPEAAAAPNVEPPPPPWKTWPQLLWGLTGDQQRRVADRVPDEILRGSGDWQLMAELARAGSEELRAFAWGCAYATRLPATKRGDHGASG